MNKIILHNHETGVFFESYDTSEIVKIIEQEIENGADAENLSAYIGKPIKITEKEVTTVVYGLDNL